MAIHQKEGREVSWRGSLLGEVHSEPALLQLEHEQTPVEMVHVLMIFISDPHIRLKRKKLGPSMDLRERRKEKALARAAEA